METDFEDLRRQLADAKAEIERLRRRNEGHVHAPTGDERTSAAGTDLLFTAAEKNPHAADRHRSEPARQPDRLRQPRIPGALRLRSRRVDRPQLPIPPRPGTDPADVAKVRDAVAARRDVVVEILNYHRDGTPFRNELYVSPVFDPDGHLRYFFASQLDVTRFRTEEGRLAESEARYRTLFEAVDAGFCIVEMRYDAAGRAVDYRFVEVNPAFERHTGLRDVAGRWVSEVVPGLERSWLDAYGGVA